MKTILLFLSAAILTLMVGSFCVYSFVDINDYKKDIVSLVQEKTGHDIIIGGDIKLRILPLVALEISDVYVKSTNDTQNENIFSVARVLIYPKLFPLLKKQVKIYSLRLINPVLQVRILKDDTNNIADVRSSKLKIPSDFKNTGKPAFQDISVDFVNKLHIDIANKLNLKNLEIEGGKLIFSDESKGIDVHVNNILFKTSVVQGYNPVSISGQVKLNAGDSTPVFFSGKYQLAKDFFELSNIIFKFGDIEAHGEVAVDFRAILPDAKVAFYFENINLDPYPELLNLFAQPSLTKSQNINLPREISANKPFAWDSKQIDFSLLQNINWHLSVKSNNFTYKDMHIGVLTLNSYLMNGKLTLGLKEAEVFGGNINGELVLDATSTIPRIKNKINLEEIDLTKIPASFKILSDFAGKVSGSVAVSSRGTSEEELVKNTDGKISIKVDDGVINGLDLPEMVKNIRSNFISGQNPERKTLFKDASADFDIKSGLARTDDIALHSEVLDFNGQGSINLSDLTINFRILPKLKRIIDSADMFGGLRTPILISGNLLQPSFRLEIQTLINDLTKNPKATEGIVKQIKQDFENIKTNIQGDSDNNDGSVVKGIKKILNGF